MPRGSPESANPPCANKLRAPTIVGAFPKQHVVRSRIDTDPDYVGCEDADRQRYWPT